MRNSILLILLSFLLPIIAEAQFQEETVNIGNLGLNVTNVGAFGRANVRNDPQGAPSMEYPINSGIEHLFEAGFWIGTQVAGQTRVSTGSIDDPSGYATGKAGFEFSPIPGTQFIERSTFTSSEKFSLQAISHQDFEMFFTDSFVIVPGTNQPISNHLQPIDAVVKLQTYAWNFSFADFFVIFNLEVTNHSSEVWDTVYAGIWSDIVVRNVNVATDGGAAFFNKGALGFVDSLHAIYAFDVNGDPGFTESYGSLQFLGMDWRGNYIHPNNESNIVSKGFPKPEVNGNYWQFNAQAPTSDLQRYDRMRTHRDFTDPTLKNASNRVQLISAGPLQDVQPGESFNVAYAVVCAKQLFDNPKDSYFARTELRDHLGWAKRTFLGEDLNENGSLDPGEDLNANNKLDRYILPEPPSNPIVKVIPGNKTVSIFWDNSSESSLDPISKKMDFEGYKLYRSRLGDDLTLDLLGSAQLIAQWDTKGNNVGLNNGFDEVKLNQNRFFEDDSTAYSYEFKTDRVLNGWQYMYILTSFDSGDQLLGLPSLESSFVQNAKRVVPGSGAESLDKEPGVYPNPYRLGASWDGSGSRSRKIIFYNLPSRAEIRIYTVAGDIVAVLNHNSSQSLNGSDAAWFNDFSSRELIQSSGEHAWDILSEDKQSISSGLYLFSVLNLDTDEIKTGKLAILK